MLHSSLRELSPGNQEITFLSLRVHVLAVVCVYSHMQLFQAVFEDNVLFQEIITLQQLHT